MNVLIWHVHGSWTTAFVQGRHTYVLPVVDGRGPDGRGRARTWDWPSGAVERTPEQLATTDIDVVVVQRPEDEMLARAWLGGRVPGRDIPMVWLEHNAPQGRIDEMRHPAADRTDCVVVHVTHTNALLWDCGATPVRVIEHGIVDPGERWSGEVERAGVVVNEPVRRNRVVGADLLPRFAAEVGIDLFGMGTAALAERLPGARAADVPQAQMHTELARRRVYLHPFRWTSLGLSLLEAMHLGMPIVALATTEVPMAVPPGAGVVTNDLAEAAAAVRTFVDDPEAAALAGKQARRAALGRYGLGRFLDDWDRLLGELTDRRLT
ncbi:MAG: glycosyltransferase [Actinobacteria bacterium]|nr:glycosyltransferase [Actinomycetota bacterium]